MADEIETNSESALADEETAKPADADKPKKDPHLERAIKERDAAKNKAREREIKLAEYEARIAEIESAKEQAAIEDEKKRNDFAAQEKRWQKEIETREKRAAAAELQLQTLVRASRESALVDAVAGKTGLTSNVTKGLLRVAADQGFEAAPEQVDNDTVADAIAKLRELAPELLKSRSTGAGSPGLNTKNKGSSEDPNEDPKRAAARAAAEMFSPLQRRKKD